MVVWHEEKIANRAKKVLNKLFDAAEDPSLLFLSDSERMKALYKMIGAKAATSLHTGRTG